MAKALQKIDFVVQSRKGNPTASFDRETAARDFIKDRAAHGVILKLVRVTTKTEEI